MKTNYFKLFTILLLSCLLLTACGTKKDKVKKQIDTKPVTVKTIDTPPGADPSVSADMGGAGFKGDGWETKADYNILGDPKAVKGGALTMSVPDFPNTMRT